ncbi:hypothetical protein K7X08_030169 [Anisodus acutangulus]|uniref:Uncharacterized protein n=1 Tax=Anisodus acutangulus TaxID=402998 RepID=A0A9Q1R677_9SOLA|nr:hypothetical protein K7X08_030169 [Anisodus acutangulus]
MELENYILGLDVYLINAAPLGHQHFQGKAWKGFLQLLPMPLQPEVSFLSTKPCYNKSSRFIMSLSKYFEGGNHWSGFGMISRMQHGGDDSHVRRQMIWTRYLYLGVNKEQILCPRRINTCNTRKQFSLCFVPVDNNGLQLHAAVVRKNNEGSIPNETVAIQAQDEDFYELFKEIDFPDSTNTSLNTVALDLDSDWFRSTLQDFDEWLEEQEETIPPGQQNSSEDHSRQTSSILEHPTSSQVMSISSTPSQIPYEGPGRGDEQVPWEAIK